VSECSTINPDHQDLRADEVADIHTEGESKDEVENIDKSNTTNTKSTTKERTENGVDNSNGESDKGEIIQKIEDTQEGEVIQEEDMEEESDDEEDDDDNDDDDDDDGWITPSNIKSVKEQMGGDGMEKAQVDVGCLTTDFAMQVLMLRLHT